MHLCVRHLKAKKNPSEFILRQTNNKQAWYTWKSITYTSRLKNQNKRGSRICTKGINSEETISLIHPECCVPLQQIQAPELEISFSFQPFWITFFPCPVERSWVGSWQPAKVSPPQRLHYVTDEDRGALCKPRLGWSSDFGSFYCRVPTYSDPAVSDTAI